ncbi:hypothetical protein ACLBX9_07125 [Methylobacterium sp. A49B]
MKFANPTPTTVRALVDVLGEHVSPLLAFAAQRRCVLGLHDQSPASFVVPTAAPWVVIIGDDPFPQGRARGPGAFHSVSVATLLRSAFIATLVVSEADADGYDAMAALAISGRSSVIIETNAAHAVAWVAFAEAVAPGKLHAFRGFELIGRTR